MVFSKSFPRTLKGSSYPIWEEIFLTEEEERYEEQKCREDNLNIIKECIDDAKNIIREKGLETKDACSIAITLFEKRASHSVYYKEARAKNKFDVRFVRNA